MTSFSITNLVLSSMLQSLVRPPFEDEVLPAREETVDLVCECGSDAEFPEDKPRYCAECYERVLDAQEQDRYMEEV